MALRSSFQTPSSRWTILHLRLLAAFPSISRAAGPISSCWKTRKELWASCYWSWTCCLCGQFFCTPFAILCESKKKIDFWLHYPCDPGSESICPSSGFPSLRRFLIDGGSLPRSIFPWSTPGSAAGSTSHDTVSRSYWSPFSAFFLTRRPIWRPHSSWHASPEIKCLWGICLPNQATSFTHLCFFVICNLLTWLPMIKKLSRKF